MRKKILFVVIMSLFLLCCHNNPNLKIYGIKYGESQFPSRYVYSDEETNSTLDFIWMFYLVRYDKKIILIDTGFDDEKLVNSYNISNYTSPISILKKMGVEPPQVTDVIITHSHFDHIGNVDKFANAKIYIQDDELNYFKDTTKNKDILDFFAHNNNIIKFNDHYELYNFFEIKKIGGHTIGSSIVTFFYNGKKYILTGDECYLLDNCLNARPIGIYYNSIKNQAFVEAMKNEENILTFHDPILFNKYREIDASVIQII